MNHRIYKYILILALCLNFSNLKCLDSKIIVKINNEIITNYDLKNKILTTLILANEEINQENINKTKPLVLKTLIELKIKENETKKYKIKTTPEEVQNNLNLLAKNNLQNLKKKFSLNNLDFDTYKKDLETELKWRKLIFFLYQKKVKIEDSEVNIQLEKILKENDQKNIEYKLTELLISYENLNDKEKKINEINDQFNELGFDQTLIKYNESLNKDNLGDLGWVNSKSLSKNILSAIEDLKLNEVSEPIVIGNSILYLKVIDKRENKINTTNIEEIKKNIIDTKKNQRFSLYSNSHLSKLKNLTEIEYQ